MRSYTAAMHWYRALWVTAAIAAGSLAAFEQPTGDLARCIDALRRDLPQHAQVRRETFETYTRTAQDLRPLIDAAASSQPEFKLPVWDYVARLVDTKRVRDGRDILEREAQALSAIERRHGIDAATVVAVFGVETDYGRRGGRHPVVDATLSRACLNLQSKERKAHFFAALWLLQEGVVRADQFVGSWAGAFGMTQFMPGTFIQHMDDGDGSGSVDIIGSVADALATTARYLKSLGWTGGKAWGMEVKVPNAQAAQWSVAEQDHACLAAADPAGRCRSVDQWAAMGLARVDGEPLTAGRGGGQRLAGSTPAALLMPAGANGPAWLVTPNFQAIWQYNRADSYALAIGLLSDALRGDPPVAAAWPTDDGGISRSQIKELQSMLIRRGHCDVVADGVDGPRTGSAIRAEEVARGLPETGRAGAAIHRLLKSETDREQGADKRCASPPPAERASEPTSPSVSESASSPSR